MTDVRVAAGSTTVVQERVPLRVREVTVASVQDLSPRMRRVVVRAESIADDFPWFAMSPTDHVKVVFPGPDGVLRLPEVCDDRLQLGEMDQRPTFRDYTVRGVDRLTCSLTLDFVLHEHGPAGRWAMQAREGQQLGVLGPRGTKRFPVGYARYLLAADETGLPALCRFIEELPADAEIDAYVAINDASGRIDVPHRDRLIVTWLDRSRGQYLQAEHLEHIDLASCFVWIAGEADELKPLRRHLLRERAMPREQVHVDGYWRRGTVNYDHHVPLDDDEDGDV